MSLQPLFDSPWVIQVHAFSALAAFFLGIIQLSSPKGTLPHRTLGAIWVILMIAVTVSSVFIRPALVPGLPFMQWFSFIHLFTVLTAFGLFGGIRFLLMGGSNMKQHKGPFIGMFVGGLVVAGALAFLPGRIMNKVLFGG
ncbi:DUF2306 domain-containing protein [Hyphococcus lacteus]|uniref:DUF2306 domain-containing protein n=1 Tax=Hyphococcus lacteus TaxID=3143536 RepID=A0ABV3Z3K3_9PROT